jgi:hypothetical protein
MFSVLLPFLSIAGTATHRRAGGCHLNLPPADQHLVSDCSAA